MTDADQETHDDPYASPSTWREWTRFVDTEPPCLPGTGPWNAEERLDYHSRFVILSTPIMAKISLTLRRLMILNRRHNGTARRGLLISGPPTTGKTTTLQQLGRSFHLADRARHGGLDERLPVVFLSVPPAATPKMLVSELARFLDLPITTSMNQARITDIVCATLHQLGTRLVLVDDVHLLNTRTRNGAETSDQMKHLSERIPATFVYAGVALDASPLLTGVRGTQIAGRFKTVRNPPLPHGSPAQRTAWEGLIQGMDQALRLEAHHKGALVRHAPYLHHRTGGRIGSLSALVREAAIAAILDGTEKITKQLLNDIDLDELAEHTPGTQRRR
ncbi:TniB family NTP-binding protein (plasmid) [Streptomyces sp. NBC_00539]|nr:TniB family NTP-binding protein [Streptomyces sp. NBC_00539]WUC68939.1 TniB family NTP-binding protein [Streptomyces sp. NBC_00539]WUC69276.1 TniB family NTP-binding protein [Streptomyces sp. NBC_00539]